MLAATPATCGRASQEWPTLASVMAAAPKSRRYGAPPALPVFEAAKSVCANIEELEEADSTDAGSSISDSESVCSSTSAHDIGAKVELSGPGWGASRLRRMPAALRNRKRFEPNLETIPGTPIASQELEATMAPKTEPISFGLAAAPVPVPPPPQMAQPPPPFAEVPMLQPPGLRMPPPAPPLNAPVLCGARSSAPMLFCQGSLPGASPGSPKRRAREAMLAQARTTSLPVKVRAPAYATVPAARLDPAMPAKKRLVFGELSHITAAAMQKLEPGEPVKKRPTDFLLAEPPRVLQLPPGLSAQPR
mmetsp:Transcript_22672/g.77433  ORF Transcript_22672/g.77433 Transcript_22672/m.77433 type:complete len:305 (-) Transcript_22672:202-1116(-)